MTDFIQTFKLISVYTDNPTSSYTKVSKVVEGVQKFQMPPNATNSLSWK